MGWFLVKRFVDLFATCYIISRNHSNTFSLINLQKTKTYPKQNTAARAICSDWYQTFDSFDILVSAEVSLILSKFNLHQENRQGKEYILMNLSKYKLWRALLQRVIAKQQSKREQTHPVYLQEVQKYEKVENVNTQNDYETS